MVHFKAAQPCLQVLKFLKFKIQAPATQKAVRCMFCSRWLSHGQKVPAPWETVREITAEFLGFTNSHNPLCGSAGRGLTQRTIRKHIFHKPRKSSRTTVQPVPYDAAADAIQHVDCLILDPYGPHAIPLPCLLARDGT
jgi:hypothetical protein